jgi:hypothetical protein
MLALLLLALAGFLISQSREPLKTLLYALGAMALTFAVVMTVAQVFPALNTEATGAATFDVMLLVGTLTTLIHSRKSQA